MSSHSLEDTRAAVYRQARQTALLRQRVYAQADPAQDATLVEALGGAEAELARLERAVKELEPVAGGGVLLDTGGKGVKPGGILLGADTTGVDAQVLLRMSHVPSGIVHLLDPEKSPLITYHLNYVGRRYVRLRLTSFVQGYSARAVDTVELHTDDPLTMHQLPTFFPDRLRRVTELTRATVHIRIDDLDGATQQQSSFPILLLARTSAYLGITDPSTQEWVDLTPYLAAWVTPNAPRIMRVLRRAAELHPRRNIVGYQVDARGVEEQVRAIFDALKAEEIVYVNSVLSFGATDGEYAQRVRLPRESLDHKSANCIDGTVLMASLLEAASLNPGIVLVPGHAFLAWERQDGGGDWDYLETTMIGSHDFDAAQRSGRGTAGNQKALVARTGDPRYFQLLSLPDLRVGRKITPME